jgi:pilus assembly protein Flp/PilA
MTKFMKQLFAGEDGATMVEYALMVALIGAALVAVVTTLSSSISTKFASVAGTINAAS